jgi:hypothetical protein
MASIRKEKKKLKKELHEWCTIKIMIDSPNDGYKWLVNGKEVYHKLTDLMPQIYNTKPLKTSIKTHFEANDGCYGVWEFDILDKVSDHKQIILKEE